MAIAKDDTNLIIQNSGLLKFARPHLYEVGKTYYLSQEEPGEVVSVRPNAGIIQPFVKVGELDDNTINKTMNVNFFGPLNLIRLFMEDLTKDKKEQYIVNVSSMGGFFPFPGQTIYGASKAALKLFTEGLFAELENTNVRVMIVLPGAMATNITKNSNVEISTTEENSSFKMLSPAVGASEIIKGIKKNKFKIFLGSDSKFLKLLYKLNSIWAIRYINKKMNK